jgi:uncharacterized membrane protein YedE/YeeE
MKNLFYIITGSIFGFTLVNSQVVSWYRIQEMFLFDNFHMYGVIGTAIVSASLFLFFLKKFHPYTLEKEALIFNKKDLNKGTVLGGVLFGLGWSITGACPGPIFSLIGNTAFIYLIVLASALLGVFVYGKTIAK